MNNQISGLIISNNSKSANALQTQLADKQIKTYHIESSSDILKTITENNINIVLIDVSENHAEIIKILKEFNPLLPIVLLLQNFSDENLSQSLNFVSCDYLLKPFDIGKLVEVIRKNFFSPKKYHKRTSIRQTISIKAVIQDEGKEKVETVTENISEGGAFLKTYEPFELNKQLKVTLTLKDTTITIKSEVIWQRLFFEQGLPPGIGVKFLNLAKEDKKILTDYIIEYKIDSLKF